MTTAHAATRRVPSLCRSNPGPIRGLLLLSNPDLSAAIIPGAGGGDDPLPDRRRHHRRLRDYKDADVAEARATYVGEARQPVRHLDGRQRDPIAPPVGSGWSVVASVPSSHRPAGAPVDAVIARVPPLSGCDIAPGGRGGNHGPPRCGSQGLRPAPGSRPVVALQPESAGRRRQPDHRSPRPERRRSLELAGVRVVGVAVIGRVVTSDRGRRDRPEQRLT